MFVKQEIGPGVSFEEAYLVLVMGFEKALKMQLEKGELASYERNFS